VQEQPPRPPRSINRKVHPDLETICLKCLEKDPRRRYSSAEAVALDLERFLESEPVRAKRAVQRGSAAGWVRRRPGLIASVAAGLVVFIAAAAALIIQAGTPVVFLMDTPQKHGVYDDDVYASNGTNATVLREVLGDLLPSGSFFKETLDARWHSEAHVIARRPNLILIHRSAFFHTTNAQPGFEFDYPPKPGNGKVADWADETSWRAVYAVEDDKLKMFLGHVGNASPKTRFLIYSRGTGGGWESPQDRQKWVDELVQRFPWLEGRIDTMFIPEIEEKATFRNKATRDEVRQHVKRILGL
jgi:hypothetical protein